MQVGYLRDSVRAVSPDSTGASRAVAAAGGVEWHLCLDCGSWHLEGDGVPTAPLRPAAASAAISPPATRAHGACSGAIANPAAAALVATHSLRQSCVPVKRLLFCCPQRQRCGSKDISTSYIVAGAEAGRGQRIIEEQQNHP